MAFSKISILYDEGCEFQELLKYLKVLRLQVFAVLLQNLTDNHMSIQQLMKQTVIRAAGSKVLVSLFQINGNVNETFIAF